MNSKILLVITVVLSMTILGTACSNLAGVRSGMPIRGIHYPNPWWDRFDYPPIIRAPIILPPPVIEPPPIFEAVPLPS